MKKVIAIMMFSIFSFGLGSLKAQVSELREDAYAELTRVEKKQWKKVARQYKSHPKTLKILSEEHMFFKEQNEQLSAENGKLMNEMVMLKVEAEAMDQKREWLAGEINMLNQRLLAAQESVAEFTLEEEASDKLLKGIVYKVQIGAFEQRRMPEQLETGEQLKSEDKGKLQKIVIGQFRELEKAKRLQDYLREMGVKDAWVVSYLDGKRVPMTEVSGMKK